MSVRHYLSAAVALTAGLSLVACDKPPLPSEATAQELSSSGPHSDGLAAARATPSRYSLDGPYASLYTSSGEGGVYREIQLDLYTVTADEAHIFYGVWECDRSTFDCVPLEQGDGALYDDEVSASRGRISVNVNTADNPQFTLWVGSGGPLDITWTELSGWSSRVSTHGRYRAEDYSSQYHGTYTTTGAYAEGTLMGVQLEPGSGFAQMGTVKDGGMTISRYP